jgi:hypothetical protein
MELIDTMMLLRFIHFVLPFGIFFSKFKQTMLEVTCSVSNAVTNPTDVGFLVGRCIKEHLALPIVLKSAAFSQTFASLVSAAPVWRRRLPLQCQCQSQ